MLDKLLIWLVGSYFKLQNFKCQFLLKMKILSIYLFKMLYSNLLLLILLQSDDGVALAHLYVFRKKPELTTLSSG